MDYELRRLLRSEDPTDTDRALVHLYRSRQYYKLEQEARLGDQEAIILFLRMLHLIGEIDLDQLWAIGFRFNDENDKSHEFPEMVIGVIPYTLNTSFWDLNDQLLNIYYKGTTPLFYILDLVDLELLNITSERSTASMGAFFPDWEEYEAIQVRNLIMFNGAKASSILNITKDGIELPKRGTNENEVPHLRSYENRYTEDYWSRLNTYERVNKLPLSKWDFPKRHVIQIPSQQLPLRFGEPYVVILHINSGRAFANDSSYNLLKENLTEQEIIYAMRYNVQIWEGYMVNESQIPKWARGIPQNEFIAYWVQDK